MPPLHLHLGCDFDGLVHTPSGHSRAGQPYLGPNRLLIWLEHQLGCGGFPENTDYLRIELYRQALSQTEQPDSFFAASFDADRFATAAALLDWRDELLLAGWDFSPTSPAAPELARLRSIAAAEQSFQEKINAPDIYPQASGLADRWQIVLGRLSHHRLPISQITLYEPLHLQPPVVRRLLDQWQAQGQPLEVVPPQSAAPVGSRLHHLADLFLAAEGEKKETPPSVASSEIVVLRARRDSDAAIYLAQLLRQNRHLRPFFLIPEMNLLLDQAMQQEGMPALGIASASLARPSLQVLKLAPAFLWEPVDVVKLMEFVTLPLKPLDSGLALEIARVLAAKPGLHSDQWFAAVYGYLEQAEVPEEVREQYEFWFNRRRYRADASAPKRDAIALYGYLNGWALQQYSDSSPANPSLLVLAEQARRIRDLLEALPEQRITFLELERIVRTIYEPSPAQFSPAEAGSFGYVHQPGAIAAPVDMLIWWNCLHTLSSPLADRWSAAERAFLDTQGLRLRTPQQEGQWQLLRHQRPVLQTARQLVLVMPDYADGAETVPSLLLGDIEAAFPDARMLQFHLDDAADRERLARIFALPTPAQVPVRTTARPRPHLLLRYPSQLAGSEYETPTSLEALFYYPHRWFFKQKLRMFRSGLLAISTDETLKGNLAHRFFEMLLLRDDLFALDRHAVHDWVEAEAPALLEREGAILLLYGREPERKSFLTRVKNAAWSLISLIRSNDWSVLHTEQGLEGHFAGVPVRGKADLVLSRGEELAIVDLKWGGASRRRELIRNGEDLQLILYAHLLPPPERWPHTAYFILEEGKIVARTAAAFREAIVPGSCDDHATAAAQIFARMERTFRWRMEQLQRGMVELRTARTLAELEALYEGQLLDFLEMKNEASRWDDYRTLLG